MKNKKGFTLIELLAVIVILAIIALIAIPIILNMIEQSRKGAARDAAYGFIDAIEYNNSYVDAGLDGYTKITGDNLDVTSATFTPLKIKGKRPASGTVTINSNGRVTSAKDLCFFNYRVSYNGKEVTTIIKGCTDSEEAYDENDETIKEPESFEKDSWPTIAANTDSDKYNVGDTKCVTVSGITSGKKYDKCKTGQFLLRIVNKSTPSVCNSTTFSQTACGFVVEFVDVVEKRSMNNTNTNAGGWKESALVTYLNDEFYSKLPTALQNSIIPTYPIVSGSGHSTTSANITTLDTTKNKIYLFSTLEVGHDQPSDNKNSPTTDTRKLDYYVRTRNTKKTYNNEASSWWLRAADTYTDKYFLGVFDDGDTTQGSANGVSGVSPAFRLGQYKDSNLNGADPVLKDDMIPVIITDDGTVKKASLSEQWYSYPAKKWANAVVLKDNSNFVVGEVIPEHKIKAYYVWIPRYRYRLFDVTSPSVIQIVFQNKNTDKSTGTVTYLDRTHSAFTYGNEELNGFWVGKFEPSVETTDACYTTPSVANCNKVVTNPTIKPNVVSLRFQQVINAYKTSQKVSEGSGMMKNDEWGAVAYLAHSSYGLGNARVRINNNTNFQTGCGATSSTTEVTTTNCEIEYGKATSYPQSTTGNITGVFDMSGCAWEYMMTVRADTSGNKLSGRNNLRNSGFNGKFGAPGTDSSDSTITELTTGENFPQAKDYIVYDNPADRSNVTGDNACNGQKCFGHALTEIKNATSAGWHGDYYRNPLPTREYGWILRGGRGNATNTANNNAGNVGIFTLDQNSGYGFNITSFRVVVR